MKCVMQGRAKNAKDRYDETVHVSRKSSASYDELGVASRRIYEKAQAARLGRLQRGCAPQNTTLGSGFCGHNSSSERSYLLDRMPLRMRMGPAKPHSTRLLQSGTERG